MTGGIPGTMNRRDEIARLLAECTRAPWTAVGSDATQWAVVSDGARNGKAPLVAFALKRADAELVAKAPNSWRGAWRPSWSGRIPPETPSVPRGLL